MPRLVQQHAQRPGDAVERVVHRLATQQCREDAQILRERGDAHGALAHAAHRGIAGADAEEHAPGRQPVQRRHRRDLHRRDARAADRRAGTDAQALRFARRQRQHGVAVGEQHLAVGHPDRVVAKRLDMAEEADFIDVRHDAEAELHAVLSPPRAVAISPRAVAQGAAMDGGVKPRPPPNVTARSSISLPASTLFPLGA